MRIVMKVLSIIWMTTVVQSQRTEEYLRGQIVKTRFDENEQERAGVNRNLYVSSSQWTSLWKWNQSLDKIRTTVFKNVTTFPKSAKYAYTQQQIPGKRLYTSTTKYLPSSCANGPRGAPQYGYACPHMTLLSNDMISASLYDGYHPYDFVYAVAGGSSDNECGACYQVQLLDAEREWRSDFPFLIVQVINSGFDVMSYQLDIFVGSGGFGYFTSCNADCQNNYCQGGPCQESMYKGTFVDWTTQAEYMDPNPCYSGGVKWDRKSTNTSALVTKCQRLVRGQKDWKSNMTVDSCVRSNQWMLHQNFVTTKNRRVQCPRGLTLLTGLRRSDDQSYPLPSKTLSLSKTCQGDRTQGHYCITTMQDCCKPSCAWPGKGRPDSQYSVVDTCHRDGLLVGLQYE